MEWKKQGRKKVKQPEQKPEWLEQDWTKDEQSIIAATKYSATSMLAIMVVKQWIRDGRPKSEYDGIIPWLNIIQQSLNDKNNKLCLPQFGGYLNTEESYD